MQQCAYVCSTKQLFYGWGSMNDYYGACSDPGPEDRKSTPNTKASGTAANSAPVGIDALSAYTGTWNTVIDHVDTAYSKAGHEEATLQNDCWKSGTYLACRQSVNGDPKILLVYSCKPDGQDCISYQIPPDGSQAGSGKVLLHNNTWTFPWTISENGKRVYFRVVNVWTSPATIEFRQEFSFDQVHWTAMATGHETRAGQGPSGP